MIPPKLRAKFAAECRMTALGGSEKGTCPCKHPDECAMKTNPHYAEARTQARARMMRYLENSTAQNPRQEK